MSWPNAEQARSYLEAGYHASTDGSANSSACNLARNPKVAARIAELKANRALELTEQVQNLVGPLNQEVFTRTGRAKKLVEIVHKIERVMIERAEAFGECDDIPGGSSGLVVLKDTKKDGTRISAVDTRTIAELRATYEQIARELGQWVEKREETEVRKIEDLTDDEIQDLIKACEVSIAKEAAKKLKASETMQLRPSTDPEGNTIYSNESNQEDPPKP